MEGAQNMAVERRKDNKRRVLKDGVSSMFAGGTLPEEDIESAFQAITQAYWKAKDMNKKFGKRKNDKGE